MAEEIQLTKKGRLTVVWRSTFIRGFWNYERMQNGGWVFSTTPAIKKLCKTRKGRSTALKHHLEFFNIHPYIASPILGVTLALEEERANGAPVDDVTTQGARAEMIGPLTGVGDPIFWFTVRPALGTLDVSLAMSGSILGPILFFVARNLIRQPFMWYTQEFGYKAGPEVTDDLSGGLLQDITEGASTLGVFVLAALVQRWVSIKSLSIVSRVKLGKGACIEWDKPPTSGEEIHKAFGQVNQGLAFSPMKVTALQDNLDRLIPGLVPLLLTFLYMWLLKKKVNLIVIIFGLFVVGVVGHLIGLL